MKQKLILMFLMFIGVFSLASCSEDEHDISYLEKVRDQENIVTVKVYSNDKDSPITLGAECIPEGSYLIIKEYYEWTVKTKNYEAQIVARCDNPTTLMTGEIYVNGILKERKMANRYLKMTCRIKGDGL